MKNTIIIVLISILAFSYTFSENFETEFTKANASYQKGDYLSAIQNYKLIINSGFESSVIWYNLGNCYYKLNKTADAIISFERAKLLAPNDEDIDFNLKVANLRTVDRFQTIPRIFFIDWYDYWKNMFSSEVWSTIMIVLLWFTVLSFAAFLLVWSVSARKIFFSAGLVSLVIALVCLFFATKKSTEELNRDNAIVFKPSAYVKSSPDEKSTDLFILHEGTKIKVLDAVGGWKKIKLANGNLGWIQEKAIEVI